MDTKPDYLAGLRDLLNDTKKQKSPQDELLELIGYKAPESISNSTHVQSVLKDSSRSQQEQEDILQRAMDAIDERQKLEKAAADKKYLEELFAQGEQERLRRQHFNSSAYVASIQHDKNLTQEEKQERLQRVWDVLGTAKLSEKSTGRTRESYYNTNASDMHSFYRELSDQPEYVQKHFEDLEYQDSNPPYEGPVTVQLIPMGIGPNSHPYIIAAIYTTAISME